MSPPIRGSLKPTAEPEGRPTAAVDLRALVGRPSGIGWFTLAVARRLAQRGRFSVLGLAQAEPFEAAALREAGARLETQPAPFGLFWQQIRLPPRLASPDVDVFWSPLFTLPLNLPVPGVVTVHDLSVFLLPKAHRFKVRWSLRPFLGSSLRRARWIAADSEATARDLGRRFPSLAHKVRIVYPGVDSEFRPAPVDEIARTRLELACPDGYLLFSGTLEPRKNVELLLDVWEALRRVGDAPPLVVCGGYGWHSEALAERIRRLHEAGVHNLGHLPRERLVRVMQAARAFVYPSRFEGFGLPVAEAMACGIPTLASRRSSLPEVVGSGGILFDPDRPAELADALRRILREPAFASELSRRGPAQAARFDWDQTAERMEELFDSALAPVAERP
jgi:glycosyltransferase involved in cell wall biosynthesis